MSDSDLANRGERIFVLLVLLFAACEAYQIISALWMGRMPLSRVVGDIVLAACFYALWRGYYSTRWGIAIFLLSRGAILVTLLTIVMQLIFSGTPEQNQRVFGMLALAMIPETCIALFYLTTALMLLWLPSLQAFLQARMAMVDWGGVDEENEKA